MTKKVYYYGKLLPNRNEHSKTRKLFTTIHIQGTLNTTFSKWCNK